MGESNLLHSISADSASCELAHWCPNCILFWFGERWRHASDYLGIYRVDEESFVE